KDDVDHRTGPYRCARRSDASSRLRSSKLPDTPYGLRNPAVRDGGVASLAATLRSVAFVDTRARVRAMRDRAPAGTRRCEASVLPLDVWVAAVCLGAVLVYVVLVAPGDKRLNGVPLHATFDPYLGWRTLLPIGVLATVALGAVHLRSLEWRHFLGV